MTPLPPGSACTFVAVQATPGGKPAEGRTKVNPPIACGNLLV
jgi:hypothetical protein